MFHLFLKNIGCEIFGQDGMSFGKSFKISLKTSMTILLRTKTFIKTYIVYVIMFKSKDNEWMIVTPRN